MRSPRLIATQAELNRFVERIAATKHLAVDSESNSYFAYRPRVCLIQISSKHGDFILDPLALKDLSLVGDIFADPAVEKIFHAAENDLIGFKRDFRFRVRNVFDTSTACRLLGRRRLGLARILSEEFGVRMNKKFQRCNWEKRPLSKEQLYYAQLDTRFLTRLRHRLHRQLLERDLLGRAEEEFTKLERIRYRAPRAWDPDGYLRLKGAQELPEESQIVLRRLFSYRENLARSTNKAPFRIMNNEFMLRLARKNPDDVSALLEVRGLPSRFKGKGAKRLLRIIKTAKS